MGSGCCSSNKNKNFYQSIDNLLKETMKKLDENKSKWFKRKNTKFLKDTKAKLNSYSNDLKKYKTPSKEDINKEKMKKIKLCLSEVHEYEGNLHQSIIELNFAQKFCVNKEKEKDNKIKFKKLFQNFII